MTDTAGRGFGPSALATPANALTVLRLLGTPIFIGFIVTQGATWWTVVVGLALAGTDGLDGWVARRQGATRSGAFLDPLADKAVVLPVILIAAREVGMSAYRSFVGRRGVSIPARSSAKVKTLIQDIAIGTCIIPPLATHHPVQLVAIWAAAAITLVTGAQYLNDGWRGARRPA
jgi:CDP-diacylglycerol--glycerol-3-phosphate 3-phosphatidyltransferase